MRKPKTLLIFGDEIQIKYIKNLAEKEECHGDFSSEKKLIRIDAGLVGKAFVATMIHELIHAISDRVGINQGIDHGVEEIIADSIGKCISENFKIEPF